MALFYECYYTDNTIQNITKRKHYLCQNCDHRLEEGPLKGLKESIPECLYLATYEDQNLQWVSDYCFFYCCGTIHSDYKDSVTCQIKI